MRHCVYLFEMGNQNVLFVIHVYGVLIEILWWLNSLWSDSCSALAGTDTSIFCQGFSPCKKYQSINVQEIFRQISHDNLWMFLDRNWMKNKIHQYYHGGVDSVNESQVIPINYYYIKQEKFGGNVS